MSTRSIARRMVAVVVASMLLSTAAADGAEIRVMISGAFVPAYLDLVPEFERTTKHSVVTSRGPSMGTSPNSIPSRLQRGEPVDVFIINGDGLENLNKQGKVIAGTRVDLARSRIGMAVRASARKPDIRTVDTFKRVLLDAKSIAFTTAGSGFYVSNELFPRLGIAEQMSGKSKSFANPGAAVARGEAEIALNHISELLPVPGIDYVGPLPSEIQNVMVFSAGIATGAQEPEAARALIQFLASPAAAPAIAKSALEPMTSQ